MFIVEIDQTGFDTQYVSNYFYRGYDHVSDVISSPVRAQAKPITDRKTADEAKACAERGGLCRARVVEL